MINHPKKISEFLHFEQTDVCIVCTSTANNYELFLKFHPEDELETEYKKLV